MAALEDSNKIEEKHTQKRKRMKKLLSEIRSQIEFYFSDANLSKDRFLKQLIDVSEDVPLDTFTKFNKLRKLTTDLTVIAKALKRSDMLVLSADGACVRRKVPFKEPKDADDRTVYVESLPPDVTIEWMQQTFGVCGRVVYVSLPRYKYTRYLKGFAFVEFETADSAQKACKVLNSAHTDAEEHVGKFPRGCKQLLNLQRRLGEQEDTAAVEGEAQVSAGVTDPGDNKPGDNKPGDNKPGKRSRSDTNSTNSDEQHQVKRKRSNEADVRVVVERELPGEGASNAPAITDTGKPAKKRRSAEPVSVSSAGEQKRPKGEGVSSEGAKKRDSISGRGAQANSSIVRAADGRPQLRVISKAEWLQLKQDYVQRQRDNLHRLKQQLKAVTQDTDTAHLPHTAPSKSELAFIPNVIVHVSSTEQLDKQALKKTLSSVAPVAYVDVSPDQVSAHVRCDSEEATRTILASPVVSHLHVSLLQGEQETAYWAKITADRRKKYDKTDKTHSKNKKQRGKDKLLSKADDVRAQVQHIVFD